MNRRAMEVLVAGCLGVSVLAVGMSRVAADEKSSAQPDPEQLTAEWEAKLEGSEWAIQLSPATGTGKPQADTLTFARGTVSSKWLSKEGFAPSNYTLTAQDAKNAEWQTTQSNPDGHRISWRIQISGDAISGALNKRTPDGQATVFYVNGTKVAGALPPPSEASPASHREPDSARGEPSRGTAAPTPAATSQPAAPAPVPATPPAAQQQPKPQASQPSAPAPQEQKKWGWW